jgi:RNA polymerase sigma-32 factor
MPSNRNRAANAGADGADGMAASWLRSAVHAPMLGREEERELLLRAEAGDCDAVRRLTASHLRYVIKIARHYRGWGSPMSDLIQEGTLGLLQAIRRFNPEREVRLSTYANWWIRSAIQEHVLHSWSVVRLGTSNAQKMLAIRLKASLHQWSAGNGGLSEELVAGLAHRFNTTVHEVRRLAARMVGHDASLERDDDAPALIDRLADHAPTPEQVVSRSRDRRSVKEAVEAALLHLTPREQVVIRKRYLDDARHTFEAIGRELDVSKDRARQLEARALAKLQELLEPVRSQTLS